MPTRQPGRHFISYVLLVACAPGLIASQPRFQRGDTDGSGERDLSDGIQVLLFLFQGRSAPGCLDAADADDNGEVQITDAIRIFTYLFLGGLTLPAPFPDCGIDPTPDPLFCEMEPPACAPGEFEVLAASFGILETIAGKGETETGNGWQPVFESGAARDAELSAPHNAMGDDAAKVYIADKEGHGIRKVAPDGKISTIAGTSIPGNGSDVPGQGTERALNNPNGLWVRGDGTVYILDTDNAKVRRLGTDGILSTLFPVPGLALGRGLWVADDEQLAYVSSRSDLMRWTPAGGLAPHASGFSRLGNIAVDLDGSVLATDQGTHKVFRVSPGGAKVHVAGSDALSGGGDGQPALETGLNEVRGVWITETGGYFLATHAGSQVWYVDTLGIIHLFLDGFAGEHAGDGEPFNTPGPKVSEVRNITLDRQGNLLITEHDAGFIRRINRVNPH